MNTSIRRVQAHPDFNRVSVRDYSSCLHDRGLAWNAWLTVDDVVVGTAWQHGTGGPDRIEWKDAMPDVWKTLEVAADTNFEPHSIVLEAILDWKGL